ncbi:MAG: ATP-binding cassette domain-containing protein [Spirochaetaceae bacterium]|nr:ATP-binding cassette domain-containing protein [Spirochaetaceae bacterium]
MTLTVGAGERWVLLGPNGSGKTSLVRLFSGYSYPSEGTLDVLGERFGRTDLRLLRARIGWVHSDVRYQIPPFMSAAEVVAARARGGLVLYGEVPAADRARACAQLDLLAVSHLADRRFATLSTGERQRVLIARALAPDVELLLLDEPAIGLDPAARERFLEDLGALFRQRPELTVVYVTHDIAEITSSYDGVLLLDRGRAVARGTPREALTARNLQAIFGPRCRLHEHGGRYAIRFAPRAAAG